MAHMDIYGFTRGRSQSGLSARAIVRPKGSAALAEPAILSISGSLGAANDEADIVKYAQACARAGFHPVVLKPNEKKPAFTGWPQMSVSTVVQVLTANPRYNLGLALSHDYLVLDVDVKKDVNGFETLRQLEEQNSCLPVTLRQHTRGRGHHILFKLPPGVRLKNKVNIAPGLDLRTGGGFIVAEPSSIDGCAYHWIDWDVLAEPMPAIAEAPAWLIKLCEQASNGVNTDVDESVNEFGSGIIEGQRNDSLFRKASALRGQDMTESEIVTVLHSMNNRLCRPPLPAKEVANIAHSAMRYLPNPTVPLPNRGQRREFALKLRTAARLFVGKPKAVRWLIDHIFPLGKVIVVASPPGIGKSFSSLELAVQITSPIRTSLLDQATFCFGGRVSLRGKVVYISAEDDEDELHRRLYALLGDRPMPDDLHIVSLPDQGHFSVVQGDPRNGMAPTPAWVALKEEILQLDDVVLIVVDTFQAVSAGDLNAAEIAQAMMNELVEVANQTGAAVMVLHHLIKWAESLQKGVPSAHAAMDAIRGSGAIAGSVRAAYVLIPHPDAKKICEELGERYEENKVVFGILAKANGPAHRDPSVYVRDKHGVLRDRTLECRDRMKGNAALLTDELLGEMTKAYHEGYPFAASIASNRGLHRRRNELPKHFHNLSSNWFTEQAENLVREGRMMKLKVKNGYQYVPVVPIGVDPEVSPTAGENTTLATKPKNTRVANPKKATQRKKSK